MSPEITPSYYSLLQNSPKTGLNNLSHLISAQKWATVEDESGTCGKDLETDGYGHVMASEAK